MCISVEYMHPVSTEAREGVQYPGTGVSDCCGPSCVYWELDPCPLKDWSVFLTSKPPVQDWTLIFKYKEGNHELPSVGRVAHKHHWLIHYNKF